VWQAQSATVRRRTSRLAKGAELIVEGYSDSQLRAFGYQQRRFVAFCELDGYDLDSAGKHAMISHIA
jgi:hypothetical protein